MEDEADGDGAENLEIAAGAEENVQLSVIFGFVKNIPKEERNVVRIFISSTFTDMKVERNVLMSSVFPKLKSYCKETHNLEFQVVDMRWGVQDQASDDHSTSELCMKEIRNCQKESAGPNFVCFLGDRYGTRYLKKYIPEEQWTILISRIRSTEVKQLLDIWYKLDTNAKVPQRILQPISSIANGADQWESSYPAMYSAVRDAAMQARNDGELSADLAQTFIFSVTEEEITLAGMLADEGMEQKGKCLAFMRTINNIDLQHEKAKRFVDMTQPGQLDTNSQDLLTKLKENLSGRIPKDNIRQYTINWSDEDGVNADDHQDYLKEFSEDFFERVKKLVDLSVLERDERTREIYVHDVSREVLIHSKQAVDKLSRVVPRTDILDKVKAYITGQSDRPLVVYGNSGCGKTSIMASIAVEAGNWLAAADSNKETAVVLRFLGTSRFSSDVELMLKSVVAQLKTINSRQVKSMDGIFTSMSVKDLITIFHEQLKLFSSSNSGTVIIILDSIDQLRKNEAAFNLSWLPKVLPQGVKFVISTLPDMYGILDVAQSRDIPANNFVEVKAMDESSAWVIIDKWLEMSDRKISDEQRAAVTTTFTDKQLPPLYIKLIFDILVKWTSYNTAMTIPEDVTACMDQLFSNLETTHGKFQVQLALAYFTCCPGGISEGELEDVLSIDNEFLNAVFQYHMPPVRRIPPSLWVRMKNDIGDYLVEKESFGIAALTWYHRQFIEHATQRYAGQEGLHTKHCMNTLCDYYMGKWSTRDKPFSYSQHQMERLKLTESSAEAPRYVAAQPTRYNRHEFNGRKISVLSQLWSNSVLKDQVYMNSSRYIMDIEFLTGKFVHDSWGNIKDELSSFARLMAESDSTTAQSSEERMYRVEFSYIHAVIEMYNSLVSKVPLALPSQLFACLQDKYNMSIPRFPSETAIPNLAWFLTDLAQGKGANICSLLPVTKILGSPGGLQKMAGVHSRRCRLFPFTFQGKSAVAVLDNEMVIHMFEDYGSITQLMSIELKSELKYGQLINMDGESYIFVYARGKSASFNYCLISLNSKRVEVESNIGGKPVDEHITNYSLTVFYNPHLSGKDSIMFYSFEDGMVTVYSLKLNRVVWDYRISKAEQLTKVICYASLHDTSDSNVKTLIITFTRHTDFYQMVLLESGEVQMTKIEETPNAFFEEKNSEHNASSNVGTFKHGQQQMDLLLPKLPSNEYFTVTDKLSAKNGLWTYYKLTRQCDVYMAGKLRSGVDVVAVHNCFEMDMDDADLIELYTAKSADSLQLSAIIHCDDGPAIIYLVPESDVLIVSFMTKTSVYFLSAQPGKDIEVRLAYVVHGSSNVPCDMVGDAKGFVSSTWMWGDANSSKIWDLTAFMDKESGTSRQMVNPAGATQECKRVVTLNDPVNCSLVLQQDDVQLWDITTNQLLQQQFSGSKELDQLFGAKWLTGYGDWQHIVAVVRKTSLRIFGVNISTSSSISSEDVSVKLLSTHKVKSPTDVALYDKGLIAVDGFSGYMVHLHVDEASGPSVEERHLMTTAFTDDDTTPCSWKSAGYSPLECCYADTVFLVIVRYVDPRGHLSLCLLIYSTSDFQLVQKIAKSKFLHTVYFKEYKRIILAGNHNMGVIDLNVTDLNSLTVSLISHDEYGRLTMLDYYIKEEQAYYTDTRPYFFIYCEKKGLLKMDVRQTDGWIEGDGVASLGKYPESYYPQAYTEVQLSHDHEYLAGTRTDVPALQLVKVRQDKLEPTGEILFQDAVSKFSFSKDSQYVVLLLQSGEVVCVKVLDPSLPDLVFEAKKLPCTKQQLCQTLEELLEDERWTSMAAISGQTSGVRNNNTLYNYMRNLVMPEGEPEHWKAKEPSVGSEEFEKLINSLEISSEVLDASNNYISAITTHPLDIDTVLNTDKDVGIAEVKPHPPSRSKPRPPSTKHKPMEVKPQRVNALAAIGMPRLPQGLLNDIQSYEFKDSMKAEETIPANLRLYHDLPTDEREKRLDGAFQDLNKHTAACSIQ